MGKSINQVIKESNYKQKENKMKKLKNNQAFKTVLTVFITLVTVAAFAATFMAGMNYQQGIDAKVNSAVESALASKTEAVE